MRTVTGYRCSFFIKQPHNIMSDVNSAKFNINDVFLFSGTLFCGKKTCLKR